MKDTQVIEVAIDNFQYTPSGLTGVPDGGTCSRDCHCDGESVCLSNRCFSAGSNVGAKPTSEGSDPSLKPTSEGSDPSTRPTLEGGDPISSEEAAAEAITANNQTVSQAQQGADPVDESSRKAGMSSAGRAFMILFFLSVIAGLGWYIYIRMKRRKKDQSRIMVFCDGSATRVECWDHETAAESKESTSIAMTQARRGAAPTSDHDQA